ncbi:uncharacterized protein LOC135844435 [Planococcus citri]|uniref:uncharacterized protein LOC135844435 n=1 Tax=Planococcus citri TaxID=170843 RepID=UPI0031F74C97
MKWTSTYAAHSYLSDDIAPPLKLTDCVTVPAFAPTLSTPQPFGYYAVTRINPLFVEDKSISIDDRNNSCSTNNNHNNHSNTDRSNIHKTEIICNETGGNYTYGPIAIGIDRDNHHIDIDIDDDHPDTDSIDYHPHEYSLRDDAFAVLKQNYDFIRSVLVSVRVNKRHCQNTQQNHNTSRSAFRSSGSKITSLPQFGTGISDRNPDRRRTTSRVTNLQSLRENECWFASSPSHRLNKVGDVTLNRDRNFYHRRDERNFRSHHIDDEFHQNDRVAIPYGNQNHSHDLPSRHQVPRNVTISNGDQEPETHISPIANSPLEIVLRCLRDKIDECLRNSDSPTTWPSSSDDPAITTLYRAYRLISAYHRKCRHSSRVDQNNPTIDEDLLEKCQVDLLQCLGRVSYYADQCECSSYSSSSVSAASTSGFSDLTPTPPFSDASTSASDSPTPVPASALVSLNQAKFNYTRIVGFTNKRPSNRFKIKNGVCSGAPQQRHVTFGPFRGTSSGKECLDRFQHRFEQCRRIDNVQTDDKSLQKPASQLRSSSYPGHRCPDFTLDVQQAEKVVEKIKNRKKERCWCQVITCCVGFAFLVFSVMSFSMVLSRGEKLFGPL